MLVIGVLSYVFFSLVTIPLVSPAHGGCTDERRPEFAWGGMQGDFVLLLDQDPDFGSPVMEEVAGNSYRPGEELEFGKYYWKVRSGPISSGVGEFTLDSSVVVSREDKSVRNEGNVELVVHSMTGAFLLGVGESLEISEDEDVVAEQS